MREPKWFVIWVVTGKEYTIHDQLVKDGQHVIMPRRKLRERRGGEFKEVERVLFPGYIFIKMVPNNFCVYPVLKKIPNILKIVGDKNGPVPITEDEALYILSLAEGGKPLEISSAYREGNGIKITDGPLKGMEGKIIKVDARRHRAKVELNMLGQKRIIELGIDILE